jgi:hypothetical protein
MIPINNKLCCIAISGISISKNILPFDIFPTLKIHSLNPFSIDAHWKKWLGSLEIEHLKKSNFIITSFDSSKNPDILDAEYEPLKEQAYQLLYSIFLQDIFPYDKASVLSGARISEKPQIRQISKLDRIFNNNRAMPAKINSDILKHSKSILVGLKRVYRNENLFKRIKWGFYAWTKAIKEWRGDDRLHQFVRSVEAVIKPEIGRSENQFVHRCKLLTKNDEQNRSILKELYKLRSLVEHMNDLKFLYDFKSVNEAEDTAELRTYQAEKLSGYIYSHIFSNQSLIENFVDDQSIVEFWKQREKDIVNQWATTLDLNKISFGY